MDRNLVGGWRNALIGLVLFMNRGLIGSLLSVGLALGKLALSALALNPLTLVDRRARRRRLPDLSQLGHDRAVVQSQHGHGQERSPRRLGRSQGLGAAERDRDQERVRDRRGGDRGLPARKLLRRRRASSSNMRRCKRRRRSEIEQQLKIDVSPDLRAIHPTIGAVTVVSHRQLFGGARARPVVRLRARVRRGRPAAGAIGGD